MKPNYVILLLLSFPILRLTAQDSQIKYPQAAKSEVKDTIWGTIVADPYRSLEKDSKSRQEWLDSEVELSDNYIKSLPHKRGVESDLDNVWYGYDIPYRSGPFYIMSYHGAVYYKDYLRDRPRFLYNTELISSKADHISSVEFSKDGKYCAFVYSTDGSDWQEIRILNMSTQFLLKEHIYNVRGSSVDWFQNGFFYSSFDSIDKEKKSADIGINQKIYYHKIGTDASFDSKIFEDKDYPYNRFNMKITDDERFAVISEFFPEENRTLTYAKDYKKDKDGLFKILFGESASQTSIIGSKGDTLLAISTNNGAYNRQLVEIDTKNPKQWGVIVENQQKYLIKQVLYIDQKYYTILKDEINEYLTVFSSEGEILKSIPSPIGSASEITCYSPDQKSLVIKTCYYSCPPIGQLLSSETFSLSPVSKTFAGYKTSSYKFYFTHYLSRDGTEIPIYIVTSADYVRQGPGAALLDIYGAFDVSMEPRFDPGLFAFLNNGGIYAIANIRGGSNIRKNWHESGSLLNKQNSIDDAYYAARFLADSGFALSDKIAVMGNYSGALVAAAAINQHPETFKAAILNAGVYDLMRYENYSQGVYWTREYGSINDSLQFKNLLIYSPLNNIKANSTYPSMLIYASPNDDRIPPSNSYKYVAALQDQTHSKNPILLHLEKKNYHSYIDDKTLYLFLFKELNIRYKPLSYYKDK